MRTSRRYDGFYDDRSERVHSGINLILRGKNEPELSIDDLLVMLFDEVEYVAETRLSSIIDLRSANM